VTLSLKCKLEISAAMKFRSSDNRLNAYIKKGKETWINNMDIYMIHRRMIRGLLEISFILISHSLKIHYHTNQNHFCLLNIFALGFLCWNYSLHSLRNFCITTDSPKKINLVLTVQVLLFSLLIPEEFWHGHRYALWCLVLHQIAAYGTVAG